jgi:hypothetical protein
LDDVDVPVKAIVTSCELASDADFRGAMPTEVEELG